MQTLHEAYMKSRKDQSIMWKSLMIYNIEKSVREYHHQMKRTLEVETENLTKGVESLKIDEENPKKRKRLTPYELVSKRRRTI